MHLVGGSGTRSSVAGQYRDVAPPHLLVYTWNREQEDSPESLVRWDLEDQNGATRIRLTHSGLVTEAMCSHNDGWALILKLLNAFLNEK